MCSGRWQGDREDCALSPLTVYTDATPLVLNDLVCYSQPEAGPLFLTGKKWVEDIVHLYWTGGLLPYDIHRVADRPEELRDEANEYVGEVAANEYECSAVVDVFQPDIVIVDSASFPEGGREVAESLRADPRVPAVRVAFAGRNDELPQDWQSVACGRLPSQFDAVDLSAFVRGLGTCPGGASGLLEADR